MSPTGIALRLGGFSRRIDRRRALILVVLSGLLLAGFLASLALGSTAIPFERVTLALLGGGQLLERLIVLELRMPRALQAVLAGLGLGLAGMLLQRATRNALASPAMLGTVDGAGLGVVLFLVLFSDANNALTVSIHWQPVAAALGAAGLMGGVFVLARGLAAAPIRLILYGVALAALAKAAITLLLITGPIHRAAQAMRWLAGAVNAATMEEVALIAAGFAPLALAAALLARPLALADLDDDTARSAGLNAVVVRAAAVLVAAGLTALVVAFVGGIGFVGLIAPHLARLLVGRAAGAGLAAAALTGGLMVVGADLLVRVLFAPIEVPAGSVTAVIGAPYLLYLLTRREPTDG